MNDTETAGAVLPEFQLYGVFPPLVLEVLQLLLYVLALIALLSLLAALIDLILLFRAECKPKPSVARQEPSTEPLTGVIWLQFARFGKWKEFMLRGNMKRIRLSG